LVAAGELRRPAVRRLQCSEALRIWSSRAAEEQLSLMRWVGAALPAALALLQVLQPAEMA